MVDEPCSVSFHGCVYDDLVVNPEHVAPDPLGLVVVLPLVSQDGSDLLSGILDHHLTSLKECKEKVIITIALEKIKCAFFTL